MLTISLDRLLDLLDKAAEVELPEAETTVAEDGVTEAAALDSEELAEILADDPAYAELAAAVGRLTPDEADEILALALFARNAASLDEWQAVVEQARDIPDKDAADELLRTLLLTEELEIALERLGYLGDDDDGSDEENDEEEEEEDDEEEEEDEDRTE